MYLHLWPDIMLRRKVNRLLHPRRDPRTVALDPIRSSRNIQRVESNAILRQPNHHDDATKFDQFRRALVGRVCGAEYRDGVCTLVGSAVHEGLGFRGVVGVRARVVGYVCALGFDHGEDLVVDVDADYLEAHGFGVLAGELAEAAAADDGEPLAGLEFAGVDAVEGWNGQFKYQM